MFVVFEINSIIGRGYLRLVHEGVTEDRYSAITLLTSADELKGFPEKSLFNRNRDARRGIEKGSKNWLDERISDRSYADRDPQVLIIGAGQAGLTVAARLRQLNVDTLVVDRIDRLGDNWRNRFHSLTLHNEICTNLACLIFHFRQVGRFPYQRISLPIGWSSMPTAWRLMFGLALHFWMGSMTRPKENGPSDFDCRMVVSE